MSPTNYRSSCKRAGDGIWPNRMALPEVHYFRAGPSLKLKNCNFFQANCNVEASSPVGNKVGYGLEGFMHLKIFLVTVFAIKSHHQIQGLVKMDYKCQY